MKTQTAYTMRGHKDDADLQKMTDLINLIDAQEHLDENNSLEDVRHWLTSPSIDPQKGVAMWEDGQGDLAGMAILAMLPPTEEAVDGRLYYRLHPSAVGTGLDGEIVDWAAQRLREHAAEVGSALPIHLYGGAKDTFASQRESLEANGFSPARYFFTMHRPLDQPIEEPHLPDGFTLSNAAEQPDIDRWLEMFNLSFIDHWGFHPSTPERRKHVMAMPSYKTEGGLLALAADGTFAAFCDCFIDPPANARKGISEGWIGALGTRRGYRKIGLGRAMLLYGLLWIKSQGIGTAALDVDAENPTGALRLYESVGFHTVKTDIAYMKEVTSDE